MTYPKKEKIRGIRMLQEDRIPKIFISYAWGSSDLVLELAQRLVWCGCCSG